MSKKNLTLKQQKNKYKGIQLACSIAEYPAIATPYAIMAGINHNEWFNLNPEPWKVGLGGGIGLVLLALSTFLITRKKEKPEISNGMIAMVIAWYAVTFVFFLLAHINMEIYKIMAYGGTGLIAAAGLEVGSIQAGKKATEKQNAIKDGQAELDKEQAKQEILEAKTIKVRVKK